MKKNKPKLTLNRETVVDLAALRVGGGVYWSIVLYGACETTPELCGGSPTAQWGCGPSNVGCPWSLAYTACGGPAD